MNAIVATARNVSGPPAPLAGAPSNLLQLFAVAAGPVAWNAQLVANYALATYPCFPRGVARSVPMPGWEGSWIWLIAINLAAVALTVVAFAIGLRCMRWAQRQSLDDERHARRIGRTRALGVAALLFAGTFFLATIFTLIAILGTPQCAA